MENDPALPLGPLNPRDTDPLGAPVTRKFSVVGQLDVERQVWLLGEGEMLIGGKDRATAERWTTVEILLTKNLTILTYRESGGRNQASGAFGAHMTPAAALKWLIEDGKGKLGPASKAAWVQACARFAPMRGMDVDRES
jgi:hypothetical protein